METMASYKGGGAGTFNKYLAGKEEEIYGHLDAGRPVLLTAPPRGGLSTILLRVACYLKGERSLNVCFFSGRDLANLSEEHCYGEVAARLAELSGRPVGEACTNALDLRRNIIEFLQAQARGLIFIVDDFNLAPEEWGGTLLNLIHSLQHESVLQPLLRKLLWLVGSHDEQALLKLGGPASWQQVKIIPRQAGLLRERPTEPAFTIDINKMEVRYKGRLVALFPQELKILLFLAQHPEHYFSQEAIYQGISDNLYGAEMGVVNLKAPISRLRRKLPDARLIHNRRGIGYAFRPVIPYKLLQD